MFTPETLPGRLILILAAFSMGLLVGSVTTFVHQNVVDIAGVDVPWGMILGLIAITGFLAGLRLLIAQRYIVVVAAVGVIGMVFLLTQQSPGGSVVVPNNVWGVMWSIAPTIVALIVVAWPRLPQRK